MSEIESDEFSDPPLVAVGDFADRGSAEAIAALLRAEDLHVEIDASGVLAGLSASYRVLVPDSVEHRARWILRESEFSDAELSYLATGKLGSNSDDS